MHPHTCHDTERAIELHIASYNIHKGFSASNRRFLLEQIRHAIRSVDADLVFLQEVVGHRLRYGDNSDDNLATQFEFLADSIWHHHAYGRNAILSDGHHGNAILSKHPFKRWDNLDISQWRGSQRGILWGELHNGVYVLCLHLGLLGVERQRQMQRLLQLLMEQVPATAPLIIAGDFNDWTLRIDRQLKQHGLHEVFGERAPARTFPSLLPVLRMDRIYVRNVRLLTATVHSGRPWQRLSDHCALSATVQIPR